MNQKLSDWASIAEIVSGIAVVVTLVFLVFGIRENTEITRAAAYERNIDSMNEWRMWLSSDDEMREAYQSFLAGRLGELTEDQEALVGWAVNVVWAIYEKTYFANQYGTLGESEWERTERNICFIYDRFGDRMESQILGQRSTKEFADYVRNLCKSS